MIGLYKIFFVLFLVFLCGAAYFIEPYLEIKYLITIILVPFLFWALSVFMLRLMYPKSELFISLILFAVMHLFISKQISENWFLQVFFVIYMLFLIYTLYVLKKKSIM